MKRFIIPLALAALCFDGGKRRAGPMTQKKPSSRWATSTIRPPRSYSSRCTRACLRTSKSAAISLRIESLSFTIAARDAGKPIA